MSEIEKRREAMKTIIEAIDEAIARSENRPFMDRVRILDQRNRVAKMFGFPEVGGSILKKRQ